MSLTIRQRLSVLALAPVLLLAASMLLLTYHETQKLNQSQSIETEASLIEMKKEELKAYLDLSYSAIVHIYEQGGAWSKPRLS
ncbi:hypothetical protein [Agarivorans sp. QJM3NY_33]|uniref:hypothetical protein n=1 Tax=Agarivorans sp. QJM3NY_33 TaxID=3421432 RepID=UPI003D7C9289